MTTEPGNQKPQRRGAVHAIVFLAVLAAGIVLIALGVPVNSLATVSVALGVLYGAFNPPSGGPPRTGARRRKG